MAERARVPGARQVRVLLVLALLLLGFGAAAAWVLRPGIVQRFLSDDGELSPLTALWLLRYQAVARALVVGAALLAGLLHVGRRPLGAWLARRPQLLPRAGLVLAGLGAGLLLAELLLLLAGVDLGVRSTNSPAYREYAQRFEQAVRPQLNALGYRDGDPARGREPGTLRLLVVGDSFVFGFGVPDAADTFPAALERELAARRPGQPPCVVFNGGQPGLDTRHELQVLEQLLPRVEPHVVLLGYYVNDVEPAEVKLAYFASRRLLPLVSDNLERCSQVWRLLEGAVVSGTVALGWKPGYAEHLAALYEPGSASWSRQADALRRLLRRPGVPVAAVLFPLLGDEQPYPLAGAHAQLEALFAGEGVPCLDLRSALAGLPRDQLQAASFDPHLSARGLALAAAATAEMLVARGLLPGSR